MGLNTSLISEPVKAGEPVELPPVTSEPEDMKKPAPPQLMISDQIKEIDNNTEPNTNTDIFDEPDETYVPKIINMLIDEDLADEPVPLVEKMPIFNGGDVNVFRSTYVIPNIRYPQDAIDNGISGVAIVEFVVERNGKVSSVRVMNKIDKCLEAEAIRVVSNSPRWEPGMNNGHPERVKFVIPIKFALQN